MFSFNRALSFLGWFTAFALALTVDAHRSTSRAGSSADFSAPSNAFISGSSHLKSSYGSNGARVSSVVGAKSSASTGETVTKRQLIAEVAQTVNMTQKDVGAVIDEFVKLIGKYLGENKEVSIPKFGLFHNSMRGARMMKNLQTGEMFTAKPVYVPNLRFYDTVKDEINEALKPE
ncbi:DNA-binding protein HU-beta/integration host factor subunit beta [Babesia caballi]|uniref:DNA-binding protein HU-beta/integration host factor subunit beta n=1 Tax=Babesia caballi TaxID=5871 RepID=A0AAV4LQR3_BABCB|nr:DNA-binding protein HU-beta/integration host factor subunit beta [Babesia caballi]